MTKAPYAFRGNKGFTLIEVLIAVSIFSIIFLSVGKFMKHIVRSSDKIQTNIEVIENARVALDFIIEEIRRAQKIKISSSTGPLKLDINGDGLINIGSGDVEFGFNGKQIKYNTQILADHIESISFEPAPLYEKEVLNTEIDSNQDGIMDQTLKITIKTKKFINSSNTNTEYEITGEVSIRYKEIVR